MCGKSDVNRQKRKFWGGALTSQQGTSCRSSVQVHLDTAQGGRLEALDCQGGKSAPEGKWYLEKQRERAVPLAGFYLILATAVLAPSISVWLCGLGRHLNSSSWRRLLHGPSNLFN